MNSFFEINVFCFVDLSLDWHKCIHIHMSIYKHMFTFIYKHIYFVIYLYIEFIDTYVKQQDTDSVFSLVIVANRYIYSMVFTRAFCYITV